MQDEEKGQSVREEIEEENRRWTDWVRQHMEPFRRSTQGQRSYMTRDEWVESRLDRVEEAAEVTSLRLAWETRELFEATHHELERAMNERHENVMALDETNDRVRRLTTKLDMLWRVVEARGGTVLGALWAGLLWLLGFARDLARLEARVAGAEAVWAATGDHLKDLNVRVEELEEGRAAGMASSSGLSGSQVHSPPKA